MNWGLNYLGKCRWTPREPNPGQRQRLLYTSGGSDIPVSKPRYVRLLLPPPLNRPLPRAVSRCHKHELVLFRILWPRGSSLGLDRDPSTALHSPLHLSFPLCIYRHTEYLRCPSRLAPHGTSVLVLPQSIPVLNFHARIRMGLPATTAVNIRTFALSA